MRWLDKYPVFPIVGNGSALLQPVARKDIAEAYFLILKNRDRAAYKEYIVSGKEPMQLITMLQAIGMSINRKTKFINVPMPIAKTMVDAIFLVAARKVDYREKLFRLTENRSFAHDELTKDFGYAPLPFEERVKELAALYQNNRDCVHRA